MVKVGNILSNKSKKNLVKELYICSRRLCSHASQQFLCLSCSWCNWSSRSLKHPKVDQCRQRKLKSRTSSRRDYRLSACSPLNLICRNLYPYVDLQDSDTHAAAAAHLAPWEFEEKKHPRTSTRSIIYDFSRLNLHGTHIEHDQVS